MVKDDEDIVEQRRTSVCPHCAGVNPSNATVCRHCMGPLTTISNSDPMGSIMARGDVFARATNKPTKPIVFWGVWLLFGPIFCICLGIAVYGIRQFLSGEDSGAIGGLLCIAVPTALFGAILWKTTRNYFRYRDEKEDDESND